MAILLSHRYYEWFWKLLSYLIVVVTVQFYSILTATSVIEHETWTSSDLKSMTHLEGSLQCCCRDLEIKDWHLEHIIFQLGLEITILWALLADSLLRSKKLYSKVTLCVCCVLCKARPVVNTLAACGSWGSDHAMWDICSSRPHIVTVSVARVEFRPRYVWHL